ncbi:MAG TPA: adenylate kinase [Halanaerobiales bacterium]|nr:adenylate kinase [Halanaerobiales bacterium]
MNLILIGLPGAGKGTQAKKISQEYNIPHISTGDIFRKLIEQKTPLGRKAEKYINKGELVPDEDTIKLIKEQFNEKDILQGFILDGFPRTMPQVRALQEILNNCNQELDLVFNIDVDLEELVKRISGRRVCNACGDTYHLVYNPPQKDGICDKCGNKLIQRKDDRKKTVRVRIEKHAAQLRDIKEYYNSRGILKTVSAEGIKELFNKIKKIIEVEINDDNS